MAPALSELRRLFACESEGYEGCYGDSEELDGRSSPSGSSGMSGMSGMGETTVAAKFTDPCSCEREAPFRAGSTPTQSDGEQG